MELLDEKTDLFVLEKILECGNILFSYCYNIFTQYVFAKCGSVPLQKRQKGKLCTNYFFVLQCKSCLYSGQLPLETNVLYTEFELAASPYLETHPKFIKELCYRTLKYLWELLREAHALTTQEFSRVRPILQCIQENIKL